MYLSRALQIKNLLYNMKKYQYYEHIILLIKSLPAPIRGIGFLLSKIQKILLSRIKTSKRYQFLCRTAESVEMQTSNQTH